MGDNSCGTCDWLTLVRLARTRTARMGCSGLIVRGRRWNGGSYSLGDRIEPWFQGLTHSFRASVTPVRGPLSPLGWRLAGRHPRLRPPQTGVPSEGGRGVRTDGRASPPRAGVCRTRLHRLGGRECVPLRGCLADRFVFGIRVRPKTSLGLSPSGRNSTVVVTCVTSLAEYASNPPVDQGRRGQYWRDYIYNLLRINRRVGRMCLHVAGV